MSLIDDVTERIRNEIQPNAKVPHHVLQRISALGSGQTLKHVDVWVDFNADRRYDGKVAVITDDLLILAVYTGAYVMDAHKFADGSSAVVTAYPLSRLTSIRIDSADQRRNLDQFWSADWEGAWPPGAQIALVGLDENLSLPFDPSPREAHSRRIQEVVAFLLSRLGASLPSTD